MDSACNIEMAVCFISISPFYSTYIYLPGMIFCITSLIIYDNYIGNYKDVYIILLQGWYVVTYALGIYHLNLFIAFLTPKIDPAMDFDGKLNSCVIYSSNLNLSYSYKCVQDYITRICLYILNKLKIMMD